MKGGCLKVSTRRLIISCEHGGNRVPRPYRRLFQGGEAALDTHRGLDIAALPAARSIARRLGAPLVYSETTRLLVDLNRSLHHKALFSEFTRDAGTEARKEILNKHYHPYRDRIDALVASTRAAKQTAIHLSIHSFTPRLGQQPRNADIGLLYDPARIGESRFCRALRAELLERRPDMKVRLNYPYRGNADGFTTWLRKHYGGASYLGIEIEINQKHAAGIGEISRWLSDALSSLLTDK